MKIVIPLLFLGILAQEKTNPFPVRIRSAEPSERGGVVIQAAAELPEKAALRLYGRRLERSLAETQGRFEEHPVEGASFSTRAMVEKKAFKVLVQPEATAFHRIEIYREEEMVGLDRRLLGKPDTAFARAPETIRKIVEGAGQAASFLEEIKRIIRSGKPASGKDRESFIERCTVVQDRMGELRAESDFTATLSLLLDVYFDLLNTQVWLVGQTNGGDLPTDDGFAVEKGYFLDRNLTVETLEQKIASIKGILSREIPVSTLGLLEVPLATLLEEVQSTPPVTGTGKEPVKESKRLEAFRALAKEAQKTAAAMPIPDEAFTLLLQTASELKTDGVAALRQSVKDFLTANVKREQF